MIRFVRTAIRPRPAADLPSLTSARAGALFLDERGAATAEYAIATMAIVAGTGHTHFRPARETCVFRSPLSVGPPY